MSEYWTMREHSFHWDELKRVETGCWIYERDGLALRYELVFPGDVRVNLFESLPTLAGIKNAAKVEAVVKQRNVDKRVHVFERGVHRGKVSFHGGCFAALDARYHVEDRRLLYSLLRATRQSLPPPQRSASTSRKTTSETSTSLV